MNPKKEPVKKAVVSFPFFNEICRLVTFCRLVNNLSPGKQSVAG